VISSAPNELATKEYAKENKENSVLSFETLHLPAPLLKALQRLNFQTPTPIQAKAIPLIMAGQDVLASAETGTGKTAAFGIPLMAFLTKNPEAAALVMTPTRELAAQVMNALEAMIPIPGLRTALLIGGEPMPRQFYQLKANPRLIVGTPGRINDHLERKSLNLDQVHYLVLDETDRMLDMGFGIQIDRILQFVPSERQTVLFSATMPTDIVKLSGKYLKNPARVAVGSTHTPVTKIKQQLIEVNEAEKFDQLTKILADHKEHKKGTVVLFVKTKYATERIAVKLNKAEFKAEAIHGDLQQRKRERVMLHFREKKFTILVATDVAARGLDVPHIELVINYDLPQSPEDYIHRVGRTARAGAEGTAINLVTPADHSKWNAIERMMRGQQGTGPSDKKSGARSGPQSGKKSFKRPDRKTDDRRFDEKKSGERKFGDKKFGDKKFGDKKPGERKFGDKKFGERTFSDRNPDDKTAPKSHAAKPHRKGQSYKPFGDKTGPRTGKYAGKKPGGMSGKKFRQSPSR
jgi:ATP-dependent RNA helicase DeaD